MIRGLLLLLFPFLLLGQDLDLIIGKIDKLFRSDFSHGEMTMTIYTPHWSRTLQLEAWSKGMEETFIWIKSPQKDKGITTLRKKTEMWNYFPKIDKVIKVPPSMMMGSWMGSDFTNDDLVREVSLLEDYTASLMPDEKAPEGYLWISLKPKKRTITIWGEIRLLVNKKSSIPKEQVYFDEHGEKIRILTLKNIKRMGGKEIPTTLEMIPLHKNNHKTVIQYLWIEFDQPLDPGIFSLRNLQKKR